MEFIQIETLPEAATPYARWEAGELSARDAATAIAKELITEIEPAGQALDKRKKARREELGTLLIRVGEPLELLGRVARWVEPTLTEAASIKKLRKLSAELRDQGAPELNGIACRIEACVSQSERCGYPMIEALRRPGRVA